MYSRDITKLQSCPSSRLVSVCCSGIGCDISGASVHLPIVHGEQEIRKLANCSFPGVSWVCLHDCLRACIKYAHRAVHVFTIHHAHVY